MTDHSQAGESARSCFPLSDADQSHRLSDHIHDAIVEFEFVDGEPIVRRVNSAFIDIFGYDADEIVGSSLNDHIVPSWLENESEWLDERTMSGKINYRRVRRETATGVREFLYRGVPAEDGHGFAVYTDITPDRQHRNRIDVLCRILRHNLRNELTVVDGSVDHVLNELDTEELDETDRQMSDTARDGVARLQRLAQKAGELYRIENMAVSDDASVDCVPLAHSVATRLESAYPDASIHVELPDRVPIAATDRIEIALKNLVENAIEHNPSGDPTVWISADRHADGWYCMTVADNGPGIPPVERAVITGDTAVTELQHGSGLGLWIATWTIERFGGTIDFAESDAGGTRVELRLRAKDRVE